MPLPMLFGYRSRPRSAPRRLLVERCEARCTPAFLIDVGTHVLLPDTPGQRIDIFLESTDPQNDPELELMNLYAEIGDAPHQGGASFDPYPNFEDVDFTGGIWDDFETIVEDMTPGSTPYHAEGYILFDSVADSVVGDGKIVTLIIDTTDFTSGEFPLKLTGVGEEFGHTNLETNFGYSQFNPDTNSNDIVIPPVDITNGTIRISADGAPPAVDLNGNNDGTGFNAFFTQGESPENLVGVSGSSAADISDADSSTLGSLTITITDAHDGADEILTASTGGTSINANYNPSTHTLSLTGNASVAAYEQVLRSLTYENTAASVTPAIRTVEVVANDGTSDSNTAVVDLTVYDDSFPWHNAPDPTNVDDGASGTTINDAILIVADLRNNGTRQLPPTTPSGSFNYIDVDRNNRATINDALVVVAELRAITGGEGEGAFAAKSASSGPAAAQPILSDSDLTDDDDGDHDANDLALLALLAEEG